jgi:hypothetical protein
MSPERGHKLQVVVEIETGESVNHLEALAQWAHFGRTRAAFHLYVPAGMVDVARRLSDDNQIYVSEIWSYHIVGDQPRFTLVHRNREAPPPLPKPKPVPKLEPATPAVAKPTPRPVAKPVAKPDNKPAARKLQAKAATARPRPKPKAKPKKAVTKQKR